MQQSSVKGDIYSCKCLCKITRKISNLKKTNLQIKDLEKEEETKPKASRRKEIIRVEIRNRETAQKIRETKNQFSLKIYKIDNFSYIDYEQNRALKLLKSEMKVSTLLLILQKLKKILNESTMNNCTPINWITQM